MTENYPPLATFYKGWDVYQQHLVTAIAPLSPAQLALRAAQHLWSIGMIAEHIIATRAGWFHMWMGAGSSVLASLTTWDEIEEPSRSAAELVTGLEATWQAIQDALARWTPADLEQLIQNPRLGGGEQGHKPWRSRQWIIWHVLEHDMHHGGELSFTLGIHGLAAIDL